VTHLSLPQSEIPQLSGRIERLQGGQKVLVVRYFFALLLKLKRFQQAFAPVTRTFTQIVQQNHYAIQFLVHRKFQLRNSQFMAFCITDQIRIQIQTFKHCAQTLLGNRLGSGNRVEAHQHGQSNPPRFI